MASTTSFSTPPRGATRPLAYWPPSPAIAVPPAGPARDAEIMDALGFDYEPRTQTDREPWLGQRGSRFPRSPSTDPIACDRLEEELARREFEVISLRRPGSGHGPTWVDATIVSSSANSYRQFFASGTSRADAISAAALQALRMR